MGVTCCVTRPSYRKRRRYATNPGHKGKLGLNVGTSTSGVSGWTMKANDPEASKDVYDTPGIDQPTAGVTRIGVGYAPAPPGQPDPPAKPEKYVTYLMYKGDTYPTVWVALKKVSWEWTGVATVVGGAANLANPSGPNANVSSALGEWPNWTDRIQNQKFQPYNP